MKRNDLSLDPKHFLNLPRPVRSRFLTIWRRNFPVWRPREFFSAIYGAIVAVYGFLTSSTAMLGVTVGGSFYGVTGSTIGSMLLMGASVGLSAITSQSPNLTQSNAGGVLVCRQSPNHPHIEGIDGGWSIEFSGEG